MNHKVIARVDELGLDHLNTNDFYDIIIIGAGPAGLFTAINLEGNKKVLILEKMVSAGRKLLLSGSGRCNITNIGEISDFSLHYGKNFKYIQNALMSFNNSDLITFLNSNKIKTVVDKNGKVFPESQRANDVLQLFLNKCKTKNIELKCNSVVKSIIKKDEYFNIKTQSEEFASKYLVISTGGITYPKTGSTGDGYKFAENMGHKLVHPKPALASIKVKNYEFQSIAGISLKKSMIYLYRNNKKINEHIGDIGFTHKGLSGPGILDFSRYFEIADVLKINIVNLEVDEFSNKLNYTIQTQPKLYLKKFLKNLDIPENLVISILQHLKINNSVQLANLKKSDKNKILENFCFFPFEIEQIGSLNSAMVTSGGVSWKDVNIKNMESKKINNLFFAGEILDIDGDTGGYNLQAAFSTAYLIANTINMIF